MRLAHACPAHKSIFRPSSDPEDDAGRRDQRPFPRSGSERTPLCWCWASLGKARSVSPGALLDSFRPVHLSVAFLCRWTLPSMIPVPALGGESLFGQFTASIGEQLAHFPVGPALTDRFWYAISELRAVSVLRCCGSPEMPLVTTWHNSAPVWQAQRPRAELLSMIQDAHDWLPCWPLCSPLLWANWLPGTQAAVLVADKLTKLCGQCKCWAQPMRKSAIYG